MRISLPIQYKLKYIFEMTASTYEWCIVLNFTCHRRSFSASWVVIIFVEKKNNNNLEWFFFLLGFKTVLLLLLMWIAKPLQEWSTWPEDALKEVIKRFWCINQFYCEFYKIGHGRAEQNLKCYLGMAQNYCWKWLNYCKKCREEIKYLGFRLVKHQNGIDKS